MFQTHACSSQTKATSRQLFEFLTKKHPRPFSAKLQTFCSWVEQMHPDQKLCSCSTAFVYLVSVIQFVLFVLFVVFVCFGLFLVVQSITTSAPTNDAQRSTVASLQLQVVALNMQTALIGRRAQWEPMLDDGEHEHTNDFHFVVEKKRTRNSYQRSSITNEIAFCMYRCPYFQRTNSRPPMSVHNLT